jgi:hypothetical protein
MIIKENFGMIENIGLLFICINKTNGETTSIMLLNLAAIYCYICRGKVVDDPAITKKLQGKRQTEISIRSY